MDHTIMVGIERDEEARDALALGAMLARAYAAPMILAGVYVTIVGPNAQSYGAVLRAATEEDLATALTLVAGDLQVSTRVIAATSVVRGLHHLAERTQATMLVLGPTHLGKAARAVGGDVTLGVLHAAPCAVVVAPEEYAEPAVRRGEIGIAYVSTPEGLEALEEAVDLASRLGARLRVITVAVDPRTQWDEAGALRGLMDAVREESARSLQEARDVVGARVPAEFAAVEGDATDELVAACDELDLLVMGSRGYGPTRRVLLGSVSSHVVHAASCPVVVLPRGVRVPAAA